jgi:hypothetical protein
MAKRALVRGFLGVCLAACSAAPPARAVTAYGVTANGAFMVRFDTATPGTLDDVVAFTGLQPGERIAGIDFRPRTGQLFGVGVQPGGGNDTIRAYVIDPATGAAELLTSAPFTVLSASGYGVSFNPAADRIRVVSNDVDDNFRINPNNGARADSPVTDTNLAVGTVGAVAYDRSFERPGGAATAYAIELAGNLCTIGGIDATPSPNGGALMNFLALGAATGSDPGFDIGPDDDAFAALSSGGSNGLYTVSLTTGIATLVGAIGGGNLGIGGLALAPRTVIAVGAEAGSEPRVRILDGETRLDLLAPFLAFDARIRRGVRVALGDVTGDGMPDLVAAPGKGAIAEIRVWDGTDGADLGAVVAFEPNFKGGVTVAAGDVDADGHKDVIVAPAGGRGPDVAVFAGDGLTSLALFPAYETDFKGGVSVAAADFDRDGDAEIVTGSGKGRASEVRVFDGGGAPFVSGALPAFQNAFLAYDASFRKGVFVAAGDLDGDGTPDVVVGPGKGSAPEVAAFSGVDGAELGRFLAFDAKMRSGVRVAVGDVNGDGRYEILAAPAKGAKGGTALRAYDGRTFEEVSAFLAFDTGYKRGVFVAGVRR